MRKRQPRPLSWEKPKPPPKPEPILNLRVVPRETIGTIEQLIILQRKPRPFDDAMQILLADVEATKARKPADALGQG